MSITRTVFNDPGTNPMAELHTVVSGKAGWTIDKYVVDDELYINHTAVDGTIGYYSFKLSSPDTRSYSISCYCNTGLDTGQTYEQQPGVLTNSTPAVSNVYVDIGKNLDRKDFSIIIGSEHVLLHSIRDVSITTINTGYSAYVGILSKSTSYVGGNIIYGSHQTGVSPEMIINYEGTWYSNDGGIFIATDGVESYFNKIAFSNNNMFNYNTRSIKLRTHGVYIETSTGVDTFEYVGDLPEIYFSSRLDTIHTNSHMRIGSDMYYMTPWRTPGGLQSIAVVTGA